MQERIERSPVGRALISAFLLVTLAAVVVINLPGSQTKDRLLPVAQPYLNATGLDQNWGIFSPNPRSVVVYVQSTVEFADGSTAQRSVPHGAGLEAYRDYRWHKFGEQINSDERAELWPGYVRYLAARERAEGRDPVRITLVRHYAKLLAPGPGPDLEPFTEEPFFTLDVGRPP